MIQIHVIHQTQETMPLLKVNQPERLSLNNQYITQIEQSVRIRQPIQEWGYISAIKILLSHWKSPGQYP
jgi:hypothetical protein